MKTQNLFGVCILCVFGGLSRAGEWRESSIKVGDNRREFRVYVPSQNTKMAPVVLSLHGGGGNMWLIDRGPTHGWVRLADEKKFLLVVPNGSKDSSDRTGKDRRYWNDLRGPLDGAQSQANDIGFISDLLDWIESQYQTDPDRVYVTGNSNGGMMTYRLLVEMSHRFAAGSAFIAQIPVQSPSLRNPSRPVPLLIWVGSRDRFMKWNGGEIPGNRGEMRPVKDTLSWWLNANQANTQGQKSEWLPDADPQDGCRIKRTLYPPLPHGAPVLFYVAQGGGHQMPSRKEMTSEGGRIFDVLVGRICRDVDGAEIAWEFMSAHRRK